MATNNTADSRGWQVNKTLQECNRYMLDHQVACDITFSVHSPDGSTVTFPAHKYMLVSRSPVFEAMLCGPGKYQEGDGSVVIKDIEPGVFKEMLRFIYTDEASVTAHNVLYLMSAAKKYILRPLVQKCSHFLENNLDVENVCTIYSHCVHQDEDELTGKCKDVIVEKGKDILDSKGFMELSQLALKQILNWDEFCPGNETEVFTACKKWATHNYKSGAPTDNQLRELLGDCVYQIRFADMNHEIFNESIGFSGILSDKEVRLFNICIALKERAGQAQDELIRMGFNLSPKKITKHLISKVSRFRGVYACCWRCNGRYDAIILSVNKNIELCGICVYGSNKSGDTHTCTVEVQDGKTGIWTSSSTKTITSDGSETPHQVLLDNPLVLVSGVSYIINICLKGPTTYRGENGQASVTLEDVQFSFSETAMSTNVTDVSQGQIPEILVRLL